MIKKSGFNKNIFSQQRALIGFLLVSLLMLAMPLTAFAHKVNIFAYAEGDTVYTESYFPDGKKVEDGRVEVYDSQGNKLLEGRSDKEGRFSFKAPKKDDLKIVINASLGHKNWYLLSKDELPQAIEQGPLDSKLAESKLGGIAEIDSEQLKKIIDASIDEKLRPIKELLVKSQQKRVSFTEVIAGIGYIFVSPFSREPIK